MGSFVLPCFNSVCYLECVVGRLGVVREIAGGGDGMGLGACGFKTNSISYTIYGHNKNTTQVVGLRGWRIRAIGKYEIRILGNEFYLIKYHYNTSR